MTESTRESGLSKKDILKSGLLLGLAIPTMGMSLLPLQVDMVKSSGKSLRKLLKGETQDMDAQKMSAKKGSNAKEDPQEGVDSQNKREPVSSPEIKPQQNTQGNNIIQIQDGKGDIESTRFTKKWADATKIPEKRSGVKLDNTPRETWEQAIGAAMQNDSPSPTKKKETIKEMTQAKVIPNTTIESIPNSATGSASLSPIETVIAALGAAKLNAKNKELNKTWTKDSLLKEEADAVIGDNDSTSIDIDDKTGKIVRLRTGAHTLDVSKLTALTEIWSCSQFNKKIKGIDKLTHLTKLEGYFATAFNFSEKNKTLEELDASSATTLTGLNNLTNLKVLKADAMTTLDVSKLTNLTRLDVNSAKTLTGLNNLTNLKVLRADSMEKLDVSKLTNLTNLSAHSVKSLDVSGCTNLKTLNTSATTIKGIENLTNLKYLSATGLTTGIGLDSFNMRGDTGLTVWYEGTSATTIRSIKDITLSNGSKVDINHLENYEYIGGNVVKRG